MKGTVIVQAAQSSGGESDSADANESGTGAESGADDGPSLPSTGMDALALGLLGLLMLGLGVGVRRRTAAEVPQPAGRIGW
jgi:LPXTG-motif cell wall-anchored protein